MGRIINRLIIEGNETANGTIIAKPANFSQVPGGHAYSTTSYVDSRTGIVSLLLVVITLLMPDDRQDLDPVHQRHRHASCLVWG